MPKQKISKKHIIRQERLTGGKVCIRCGANILFCPNWKLPDLCVPKQNQYQDALLRRRDDTARVDINKC